MSQKRSLTIPGRYSQVKDACDFIADGARSAGFSDKVVFQVELACDEACTNVIEHAYGAEDAGDVRVTYEIVEDAFVITIEDNGRSFDPAAVPAPTRPDPDADNDAELRVGGLGLHLMRQTMDDISFSFHGERGNVLVMKKQLPSGAEEAS